MAFDFASYTLKEKVEARLAKAFRAAGFTVRDPGPAGGNLVAKAPADGIFNRETDLTVLVAEIVDIFRDAAG